MGVDNLPKGTADNENNHPGERSYWLAWSQIPSIGPVLLRRLEQHFGTLAAAWVGTIRELQEVEGLGQQSSLRIGEN